MSETKDQPLALNVRLKPSESSAHPRATNYTNVAVAQGVAYVDFGFIEPRLLAAVAKMAKDGQAASNGLARYAGSHVGRCSGAVASADSASLGQPARGAAGETEAEGVNRRRGTTGDCTV